MKKRICLIVVLLICVLALAGCGNDATTHNAINDTFNFTTMEDVVFELNLADDEDFICLEGNNIANGDYKYLNNILKIKKDYLVTLDGGQYDFAVNTTSGKSTVSLNVDRPYGRHEIINGSFETGDLFGWTVDTVFKGEDAIQSFINDGIRENTVFFTFEAPYNGQGKYVYGFDDRDGEHKDKWNERMGIMKSSVFNLDGSGFVSFMLGGGKNNELCYLSVRNADTDIEVARYGNQKFNSASFMTDPENYFEANLVNYKADLSEYLGENLYFEFVDLGGRDWDLLTIDNVVAYNESEPTDAELATDIKPQFDVSYITNQLPNGNFKQGMNYWTESDAKGFNKNGKNTFLVDGNTLKSNAFGDKSRGLIRSSLFRIDGSGIVSLRLGAAQGRRFDKDTYVSIKEYKTNRELIRFTNTNHNGVEMVEYFVDLSDHIGKNCYFEIIDNAESEYDTIFISDIVTYYETAPSFNYGQTVKNLNY